MFAVSPLLVANAPAEATMGLVQKVFYLHLPSAWLFLVSAILCGVMSIRYLINGNPRADRTAFAAAELTAFFGLLTLVTGPLWARRSWGTWWVWDVRVTSSLVGWMIALAYLLLRKYGGPGSSKLAAAVAIFGMANVPFIYFSVRAWRTIHPTTDVIPTLPTSFGLPLWFSFIAFLCLFALLLRIRIELEDQRARVDALFVAAGE
jgi:heme exporter protein C